MSQAIQGAGTGATIGTAIAPGIGTVIGAGAGLALGGLSSLLGRKKRKRADRRVSRELDQTTNLRDLLRGQYNTLQNQDARSTATFQSGRGALADILRNRTRSDSASAAVRGLQGGEFEIAQGASRNQASGEYLRNLLGQSEAGLRQDRQNTLGNLLNVQGQATSIAMGERERLDRRRAANQQMVSQSVQNAFQTFNRPQGT